jgi:hypothetical protein
MATRIKVTLDTDQWALVWACVGPTTMGGTTVAPAHWKAALRSISPAGLEELGERVRLASEGTGEGEACDCQGVAGE